MAVGLWAVIFIGVFASGGMTLVALFVFSGFLGICHGLIMPNSLASLAGAVPGLYGSAAGLAGAVQMFGGSLSVYVLFQFLQDYGLSALVAGLSSLSLLAFSFDRIARKV